MLFIKLHDANQDGLEIFINPSRIVSVQRVDVGRSKGKTRLRLDDHRLVSIVDVNESPEEIIDMLNRL